MKSRKTRAELKHASLSGILQTKYNIQTKHISLFRGCVCRPGGTGGGGEGIEDEQTFNITLTTKIQTNKDQKHDSTRSVPICSDLFRSASIRSGPIRPTGSVRSNLIRPTDRPTIYLCRRKKHRPRTGETHDIRDYHRQTRNRDHTRTTSRDTQQNEEVIALQPTKTNRMHSDPYC